MLCSLLLHTGSKKPIVADRCDVSFQVVGLVGQGKANITYRLREDVKDAVIYVPSIIDHRDPDTRQEVRLTSCWLEKQLSEGCGGTVHTFSLCNNSPEAPGSTSSSTLTPRYDELKKQCLESVSYCSGAQAASKDVMLYVADLSEGCQLQVHLEFLVSLSPSGGDRLHYLFRNDLPCRYLSYTLSFASPTAVAGVEPIAGTSSLRWSYVRDAPSIVEVSYQHWAHESELEQAPFSSGFALQLAEGVVAGCCSVLTAAKDERNGADADGVMMLNCTVSSAQFADTNTVPHVPFHPSEFVFMIDCSASMSGKNIQAAADTLITCIKSLPEGSYFNVVKFGSTFVQLFSNGSVKYEQNSMEIAVHFANSIQASLGGTELLMPLRSVLKKPSCKGLPRQVFIVTDGEVANTQAVINTVQKYRHQARCHTFGIGKDACKQLVSGIAAVSGGKCVLLSEEERLQTKVMEVFQDSLQPAITNTVLRWEPPRGYAVADTTPKNPGILHVGNSVAAFAFLKRTDSWTPDDSCHNNVGGSVTVYGQVCDEDVELKIDNIALPSLTSSQHSELAVMIQQAATWSKINELETQVASSSRKNSQDGNSSGEPAAKKMRLNGLNGVSNGTQELSCREELAQLSLKTGIPSTVTYLKADSQMLQISPVNSSRASSVRRNIVPLNGPRKRPRRNHTAKHEPVALSFSSIAKNTLSAVSSTIKKVVNASTLGLMSEDSLEIEIGAKRLEDLEDLRNGKPKLQWDERKNQLVYPSMYYDRSKAQCQPVVLNGNGCAEVEEDDNFTISDTESNSSVDPDWDDLHRPTELLPLIHMQTYSGAWPLVRAFSYAVGVPLDEIKKLPTCTSQCREEEAHFWATALAVECLKEYFSHLEPEWKIVAHKGQCWLQENRHQAQLDMLEIQRLAKNLVLRHR